MRNLLVPIDLSEISTSIVEQASCLAQSFSSRLWLLHVTPPVHDFAPFNLDRDTLRREAAKALRDQRRQLHDLGEQLRQERIHVITRFVSGTVNTTILAEAKRINADLIIIGSHRHGSVYHVLFGGIGQKVMRKAPCPVMLVSPPRTRPVWRLVRRESRTER